MSRRDGCTRSAGANLPLLELTTSAQDHVSFPVDVVAVCSRIPRELSPHANSDRIFVLTRQEINAMTHIERLYVLFVSALNPECIKRSTNTPGRIIFHSSDIGQPDDTNAIRKFSKRDSRRGRGLSKKKNEA